MTNNILSAGPPSLQAVKSTRYQQLNNDTNMAIKSSSKGMTAKEASKRPRPESPSDTSSASGSVDGEDDRAAMLAALEAHGRAMFGFDGPEEAESSEQGRKRLSGISESGEESADSQEEDDDDAEAFSSDDGWGEGDEMVTDSEDEMMIPGERYFPSLDDGLLMVQL